MGNYIGIACFLSFLFSSLGIYPERTPADRLAYVDDHGVLRWQDDNSELVLFGVNYYPHHYEPYKAIKEMGGSFTTIIREDLKHLVRMDLDLIRLHVFDREISDLTGSLIENEHLALMDFIIATAKSMGIYIMLTPIAWWPTVNPNEGFSNAFTMLEMTTQKKAWEVQIRYLNELLNHVNPFTGYAYRDEPAIVVLELINEPQYPPGTSEELVREYIDTLVSAVRETGCEKPLFYNPWGGFAKSVQQSQVDGATFVWYPTGLVAGRALTGNFLPRIDVYPTMHNPILDRKAKAVYEFDAADLLGNYLYLAMARTFRTGGVQIAAQFQYDPLPLAPHNRGWMTHYLNLVYTPNRAIAMLIAGKAFRTLPRGKSWGRYPENTRFDGFHVSYEQDLAEYVSDEEFFYSNTTQTIPPKPHLLKKIIGCGFSPVVRYEGTGAYFLEKCVDGIWRLEVYPDAVWVADPFAYDPYGDREVARINSAPRRISVHLPHLGNTFWVYDGKITRKVFRNTFLVSPGVYVLHKSRNVPEKIRATAGKFLNFPKQNVKVPAIYCPPIYYALEDNPLTIRATVTNFPPRTRFRMIVTNTSTNIAPTVIPMHPCEPYTIIAQLPAELIKQDELRWVIEARHNTAIWRYPAIASAPLFEAPLKIPLFIADTKEPFFQLFPAPPSEVGGRTRAKIFAASPDQPAYLQLQTEGFFNEGEAAAVRVPITKSTTYNELNTNATLICRIRSRDYHTPLCQVALIQKDGNAYGVDLPLLPEWQTVYVPVSSLKPLWDTKTKKPNLQEISELQFTFGMWNLRNYPEKSHIAEIQAVWLMSQQAYISCNVLQPGEPVPLFDANRHDPHIDGHVPFYKWYTDGSHPGQKALTIRTEKFGSVPSSIGFRNEVGGELESVRNPLLASATKLRILARGATLYTNKIEVVLLEEDGSPWGTVIPITKDWKEVEVPLENLTLFRHWDFVPTTRGFASDRFHPEHVAAINVCFGAWLYPNHENQVHCIQIEKIWLSH